MPIDTHPGSSFMDDFYAECDDHLRDIRRSVLVLENNSASDTTRGSALQSIFRSFHSLKGILGMAGLQLAERLAHRTEDYLRGLSRQEVGVSSEGMDALLAATMTIEQLVSAHREGTPTPDITALLSRLAALTHEPSDEDSIEAPRTIPEDRLLAATNAGIPVWHILFSPS